MLEKINGAKLGAHNVACHRLALQQPDLSNCTFCRGELYASNVASALVIWHHRRRAAQLKRLRDGLNRNWVEDRKVADRMTREINEIEYQIATIAFEKKKARERLEGAVRKATRGLKDDG